MLFVLMMRLVFFIFVRKKIIFGMTFCHTPLSTFFSEGCGLNFFLQGGQIATGGLNFFKGGW